MARHISKIGHFLFFTFENGMQCKHNSILKKCVLPILI